MGTRPAAAGRPPNKADLMMNGRQRKRRPTIWTTSSSCSVWMAIALLTMAATCSCARAAANPVHVGFRSAVSNSPFLSRVMITAKRSKTSQKPQRHASAQPTRVTPVSSAGEQEDDEVDDSLTQSAFWVASSPSEILQSRYIEFPVSRQTTTTDEQHRHADGLPESELEFLESQTMCGGNHLLASLQKRSPLAALAPVAVQSSASAPRPPSRQHRQLTENNVEEEDDDDLINDDGAIDLLQNTLEDDLRGGVAASRNLVFWETMVCGAISRSVAQTIMHPANTMKTMLQSHRGPVGSLMTELLKPSSFRRLTYGAGANFVLSVPTGALNFAVLEFVRHRMDDMVRSNVYLAQRREQLGAGLDFMSSALSTIACSVVATPQMMIVDNIMAGNYPNLLKATTGLYAARGPIAFYRGWWPGLVGKIPSYALTWTLFQQLKQARNRISNRPAKNYENSIMGCLASGTTVCVMIPLDTIKTRLVTQAGAAATAGAVPYKGIIDCAIRVAKEEGMGAFYRGLPPRLVSVVPMIGIQFGVYEAMKKAMLQRQISKKPKLSFTKMKKQPEPVKSATADGDEFAKEEVFEVAAMEVASSGGNPMPAPHIHKHEHQDNKGDASKKNLKEKRQMIKTKQ